MGHEEHHLKPGALEFDRETDSPSLLLGVWAVIIVLALASIGLSSLGLGKYALPVQLAIATVQAALVAYYFMHLRQSDRVVILTALSSLFWMAILFILVLADYLTRPWHVGW
ncbi:MAG: cytochrome C oxidase subunit IV family protein [Gemmataceae bacterium]|nr:cytochrome C oxidase subunit IV family protein [Gemmataceae bacterium]MCS7270045.1 cytochrome C oxidase subunit IV family protein [Gemmataceae bacterium]MDW8243105.1 cytochrome C oxidase subunit IV family protein [Thermogemmata sp.]